MFGLFLNCSSLTSLPNISNWNTSCVVDFDEMFNGCESLDSLPDISKWDTSNAKSMNSTFRSLKLLLLPNISKWNTEIVEILCFLTAFC